jgi:hypothetical protein
MPSRRGPDNSVRVVVTGTLRGNATASVLYCQLATSSTIAQADLDAWLVAFAAAYKTRFQTLLPSDWTVNYFKAVAFTPGGLEVVSSTTPSTWSGTAASTSASAAICAVISWQTPVYWRGGKPRTYMPVGSGYITSGTDFLTTTHRTNLAGAAVGFHNDVNALTSGTITGTQIGFVSFRSGNADRTPPLFFATSGAVVHPRVGSQRRRLGKWQN